MSYFKGKTVIVTGASSGIGEATAKEFLLQGAKVILVSRSESKMQDSFKDFSQDSYSIYPFDLTNLDEIDSFAKMLIAKEGPVDILFNNAGVSQFGYFEESDLSVLDKIMELDFFSVVQFTKSILPHMVSKKSGQIVTNTSVAGLVGSRNRSFYSSAKFALHGFFDSIRSEIIHHNVHVTLIAPGRVATDVGRNALTSSGAPYGKDDRGHQKGLTSSVAAKRILKAIKNKKREAVIAKWNDIAWLAVYIRKFSPSFYFFLARRIVA
jgi:short-subunit dehydrogenase|tara:strand:+ start:742 stop:1539 length:798 start_codon:yes stop_codon:yes gene_type:complete